jgi:RND family efflux transporter MFP subunit
MKKISLIILGLMVVVFIGFKGKSLLEQRKTEITEEPLPKQETISVSVVNAKQGMIKEMQPYLAQVASDKSIQLSTKMAGYIQKIHVKESQKVEKGQRLATIDDEELCSNIALLQTTLTQQYNDLTLAQQIHNRNQKLYHVGGLAKEQLDTSRVMMQGKTMLIKSSQEKIAQLEHQKIYLQIKAPFSGEIDTITQYEGDLATAGRPILSMSNGIKKLTFSYVAGKGNIQKGQKVYANNEQIGAITQIRTLAKQGLIQAEVALNKGLNLPLGSSLNINILTQEKEGCIVPHGTLLHKKEGTFVMQYTNDKFMPMQVENLISEQEKVLINPCPTFPIALESEVKLSLLPVYDNVIIKKD